MTSPMSRVNEIVSNKIGDYLTNVNTWGGIMYNVLDNGLVGGGVTDDTAALQTLINTAIAAGRKAIYFPAGEYFVTALTNADQVVFFGDNASFVGGYMGLITQFGIRDYTGMQRQAMINGGFAVNQRVVSGTVTKAAGVYAHDRWKAGASGCTYTFATVNNVTTITITAGSLVQVIEGLNLESDTYTLSWSGTAQGKIGAGSYGVSGITGTAVGGTNLSIEFNTGTLSEVQFNIGNQALPFQPKTFAQELQDCLRYYEKSYDYSVAPTTVSSTGQIGFGALSAVAQQTAVRFASRKRAVPTVLTYDPVSGGAGGSGTSGKYFVAATGAQTDGNINAIGETGFALLTPNTAAQSRLFHYTAEAEL